MKILRLILCVALIYPIASTAQTDLDEIRAAYKEEIAKTMKKRNIVGVSIAIVSSKELLSIDHFGYSDEENQVPITDETIYGLGSVTKVFTAAAVMQLAEQEKIVLDHPLSDYLPYFQIKGNGRGVTPRNVLTHHSGLPSDIFKGMFSHQPEHYTQVVEYMNQEYMAGIPNQIRSYSNPGYTLLGHMVAEVTGMEYADYIHQQILRPLEMNQTQFNAVDLASKTYDSKGKAQTDAKLRDTPAGGLFSTAKDMSRFLQGMLSQSQDLLWQESFDEMLSQQHPDAVLDFANRYALGWSMTSRPHAGDIYTHTGTTLYFNAAIAFSPKADVGVVILTNSDKGGYVFRHTNQIIEQIAKGKNLPKEAEKPEVELGSKKRIKTNVALLEKYTGVYAAPGAYIEVFNNRKKLYMKLQGLRLELIPVENDQFIPKVILLRTIPIRLGGQRVQFETIEGYDMITNIEAGSPKEMIATKFDVKPIPVEWEKRTGNYKLINTLPGEIPFFEAFKIEKRNELLVLSFKTITDNQKIDMVLDVVDENRAVVAGLGRYGGQSVTHKNGVIRAFGNELTKTDE